MVFNSYLFALLFLPLAVGGYYTLNHFQRFWAAKIYLLGMSWWFYGYFNTLYLGILIGSICVNFAFGRLIGKITVPTKRKTAMIIGVSLNLATLFLFKYYDFFIENVNAVFGQSFVLHHILLPLGISFFTFQQVSYIVDCYRGGDPGYQFWDYALFVSFFPQLVAGPIVLHGEMVPQFNDIRRKKVHFDQMYKGLFIFTIGLFKKVVMADTFGNCANWAFDNINSLNSTTAIIGMLAYTFQIYFDFSGYSDMATGMCRMFNFYIPQNFNSPYKAHSVGEFWKRWHMTLTRFFRLYVYFPLGGNRKGKLRSYFNIMVVFLLSGLWHGANWTFVLWGLIHGVGDVLSKVFQKWWNRIWGWLTWIVTFAFISLSWVLFRAESFVDAKNYYLALFSGGFGEVARDASWSFLLPIMQFRQPTWDHTLDPTAFHSMIGFFVAAFLITLVPGNAYHWLKTMQPRAVMSVIIAILFVWCVLSFTGKSTFLYFNF